MKASFWATAIITTFVASIGVPENIVAAENPDWRVTIEGMPEVSGGLVVVTKGGWNTIYRLSEDSLSITIRVNSRAEKQMVSIADDSTGLKCNGLVTLTPQETADTTSIDGNVACGAQYRPDNPDLLSLKGSFTTRK